MKLEIPNWLIITGAIGQMFTAVIYPYIRHVVFDWYNDIKKLKPLNQEIAKTYGRYIQGLNFSFGFISILFTQDLKNETSLAVALTGLIAAYWTGKIIIQFGYYPMYDIPPKKVFKIGEVLINTMFVAFALIFIILFISNAIGYFGK